MHVCSFILISRKAKTILLNSNLYWNAFNWSAPVAMSPRLFSISPIANMCSPNNIDWTLNDHFHVCGVAIPTWSVIKNQVKACKSTYATNSKVSFVALLLWKIANEGFTPDFCLNIIAAPSYTVWDYINKLYPLSYVTYNCIRLSGTWLRIIVTEKVGITKGLINIYQ